MDLPVYPHRNIEVGVWYKHLGDFAFIYVYEKDETYDYKEWIAKYIWIGEMENRKGGNTLFCEKSEFTTGSEFHRSLYKITRPDLIPPPDVMAKISLILDREDQYTILYPGYRKPGQIHPWKM
jgi:hypothetical protein